MSMPGLRNISGEKEGSYYCLLFLGCMPLLLCSVIMRATGTRQVIYTVECVARLPRTYLIGATAFLGQTVDRTYVRTHTHILFVSHTHTNILFVSHTQTNASTGEGDVHYSPGRSSSSPI